MENRAAAPATEGSRAQGSAVGLARRWRSRGSELIPIGVLVALCAFFTLLQPRFFSFGNAMIILQQSVSLLAAALGMTFVIVGGSIDLSVGSILALSALVSAASAQHLGVFAFVPAVVVGTLAGLFNGLVFAVGRVPSFIATLGTMITFRGIVLFFTKGAPISIEDEGFLDLYSGRTFGIPHSVMVVALFVVVAWIVYNRTVFGREVRAIGGGERVARLSGIQVRRVKLIMFTMTGALCGIAGLLESGRVMAATAQLGTGLELSVIAAVVVGGTPLTGGVGSIRGTILGTLIIGVLSNGMNMASVDPYLQEIVQGLVLVGAVFVTIDRSKIGIIK
jgi:ribose transport system permease protein